MEISMGPNKWRVHNPAGSHRVVVTKELPGKSWLNILLAADCRVEICMSSKVLSVEEIKTAIGSRCTAAIGQLTETWQDELLAALKAAGGRVYSNYAVGFNNVDIAAATRHGLPVGNTPGVLTETTAQMAVALTFAAARRTGEAERFLRAGRYDGWLPMLFIGALLWQKTVGIIGAGRIGAAYGRMMVEGHKMDLVYYDLHANRLLEDDIAAYGNFLQSRGQKEVTCRRADSIEGVLREADCVSLHTVLDDSTRHLIDGDRLALMKDNAILVNTSRGPVVDETALVEHCRSHPGFRVGLDVFEDEPALKPGLADLDNVVIVPHIASATDWTRQAMATLAACNVVGILQGYAPWNQPDVESFLGTNPPQACPSILNGKALDLNPLQEN